jgi:hypothetical protein
VTSSLGSVGRPTAATPARARAALLQLIAGAQRADGGWGAEDGRPSNTEATALSTLALAESATSGVASPAVARGVRWLTLHQHPAGSWPATEQVPAASWMGSVAVLALALSGAAPAPARRGGEWLLGQEGYRFDWRSRLALWVAQLRGEQAIAMDAQLKGWPWVADTFSWVEPTSLAMLALRALERDEVLGRSAERRYRLEQGEKLLADRAVPEGGWNYGNSRVLDEALEAYPDTTAWALLALRGSARAPLVDSGLAALDRLMRANGSPLARALAVLALRAHRRDAAPTAAALAAQCASEPPPADARTRALAAFALGSSSFPFVGAHGA